MFISHVAGASGAGRGVVGQVAVGSGSSVGQAAQSQSSCSY